MKEITQEMAREAKEKHGSLRATAKALNIHRDTLQRLLEGKAGKAGNGGGQKRLCCKDVVPASNLEASLDKAGCRLTPVSLTMPKGFTFVQAETILTQLLAYGQAMPFWLGDLLVQEEMVRGETYAQLVPETHRETQTLKDYHWVASKVAGEIRRQELSYNHHKEVAKLEPKEQEKWLKVAVDEGLSTRELRHSIANNKVMHADEIEKKSGANSGIKEPDLLDVLEDFEKWEKARLPRGEDDLKALSRETLQKQLEILRPINAHYVRVEQTLKHTVEEALP